MADAAVVENIRKYLRDLNDGGMEVRFGVLFGSFARGEEHEWSDIDLLVVSPRFDGKFEREEVDKLWATTINSDIRIEPIPCGDRMWIEDDSSLIVEVARREGQVISI
ncbi:MAG: nucleotidyltransferase domain-containing protein [Nitrospinae bacterium]|nr:nucleotidyltransferase domain-containing protein [Nitrospinota bacterium]